MLLRNPMSRYSPILYKEISIPGAQESIIDCWVSMCHLSHTSSGRKVFGFVSSYMYTSIAIREMAPVKFRGLITIQASFRERALVEDAFDICMPAHPDPKCLGFMFVTGPLSD